MCGEVSGHLCAHVGYIGPGEPPEEGDMKEMTQTQNSKLEPWRSKAEHANFRLRGLPTILTLYE